MTSDLRQRVLDAVERSGADYEAMECDPDLADTAAFCTHYDIPLDRSANAIVLASKRPPNVHAVFVVLATTRLDVNGVARRLMDVKKVSFAHPDVTEEKTGMLMGGVTPFGLPDDLHVYVDAAVVERPWVVVGGGTRDLKLKINPDVFSTMEAVTIVTGLATGLDET
ncbi:MAG: YbaK/EbsC family protein [Acidimicrobiia bacterium]